MSRYNYSSGPWEHMPQKRKSDTEWGYIGCAALALVITSAFILALSKTLPEAACYHANYDNPEECINVGR